VDSTTADFPPETRRFRLRSVSRPYDPRTCAARRDIADIALADQIFAPRYAEPMPQRITARSTMVRGSKDLASPAISQLLQGEGFSVLDISGEWAWGFCEHDGYVGYVPLAVLGPVEDHSHVVSVREAILFAAPDIKSNALGTLPMGARVAGAQEDAFIRTDEGFIHERHLIAAGRTSPDFVATAERLIGSPYLWGGRGAGGIDCSGLVQLALGLSGTAAPRDSDQQLAGLGTEIGKDARLSRGDLVFFPGHVGIAVDDSRILHANAYAMAVTVEPLEAVVDRLRESYEAPIIGRRRLLK